MRSKLTRIIEKIFYSSFKHVTQFEDGYFVYVNNVPNLTLPTTLEEPWRKLRPEEVGHYQIKRVYSQTTFLAEDFLLNTVSARTVSIAKWASEVFEPSPENGTMDVPDSKTQVLAKARLEASTLLPGLLNMSREKVRHNFSSDFVAKMQRTTIRSEQNRALNALSAVIANGSGVMQLETDKRRTHFQNNGKIQYRYIQHDTKQQQPRLTTMWLKLTMN